MPADAASADAAAMASIACAWPSRSKPGASVSATSSALAAVARKPDAVPRSAGRRRGPAARRPGAPPRSGSCGRLLRTNGPAGDASSARLSLSAADRPSGGEALGVDRGAQEIAVADEQLAFLAGAREIAVAHDAEQTARRAVAAQDPGSPARAPPARPLPARSAPAATATPSRSWLTSRRCDGVGGRRQENGEIGADREIAIEPADAHRDEHEPDDERGARREHGRRSDSHSSCSLISITDRSPPVSSIVIRPMRVSEPDSASEVT